MSVTFASSWSLLCALCFIKGKRLSGFEIYAAMSIHTLDMPLPVSSKKDTSTGIILDMGSINERLRYIVTASLFGWTHTQNDPCSTTG